MSDRTALGQWGEEVAARHLQRHGYRILRRNFRPRHGGEVDLVARHLPSATLVFIEVKTRTSEFQGRPADAVDEKKQRLIIRGAMAWLRLLHLPDVPFRFDIVEVLVEDPPLVSILPEAFCLPDDLTY